MDSVYLMIALGAALAGFVQGLSGFAFGLVAVSLWAWVLEPRLVATLVVFGSLVGQAVSAISVRRGFDLKQLLPFVFGGLAGVPLGVALLPQLDMDWFKLILGTLLVLWCPAMLMAKRIPRITRGGRTADVTVGFSGGVLGGLGGFTGVLPTLWCSVRGYPKDVQRAVIQNFNLSILLVTMGTYLTTGVITRDMLPLFAIVAPAMLLPALLGARLYHSISERHFRQLVLGLLAASGAAMLVSALASLLGRTA